MDAKEVKINIIAHYQRKLEKASTKTEKDKIINIIEKYQEMQKEPTDEEHKNVTVINLMSTIRPDVVEQLDYENLRQCIEAVLGVFPNVSKALDVGKKYVKENNKEIYIEYLKLVEIEEEEEKKEGKVSSLWDTMEDLTSKTDFLDYASSVVRLVRIYMNKLGILKKVVKSDNDLYGNLLFVIDEYINIKQIVHIN